MSTLLVDGGAAAARLHAGSAHAVHGGGGESRVRGEHQGEPLLTCINGRSILVEQHVYCVTKKRTKGFRVKGLGLTVIGRNALMDDPFLLSSTFIALPKKRLKG